jgi:hypothetical protein
VIAGGLAGGTLVGCGDDEEDEIGVVYIDDEPEPINLTEPLAVRFSFVGEDAKRVITDLRTFDQVALADAATSPGNAVEFTGLKTPAIRAAVAGAIAQQHGTHPGPVTDSAVARGKDGLGFCRGESPEDVVRRGCANVVVCSKSWEIVVDWGKIIVSVNTEGTGGAEPEVTVGGGVSISLDAVKVSPCWSCGCA